jgi:ABC-type sugar transport system ATPase subunit
VLDVSLSAATFAYPTFTFDVSATFERSTYTAIVGPPACGASTLLKLIAGELRPRSGQVRIGTRVVNALKTARRPLLYVTSVLDVSPRWSVQHALVAAVRGRTLDREDRHREYSLAVEQWRLAALLERKVNTLSSTERALVQIARIELLKPAIVVADRLFESVNPSLLPSLVDDVHRMLRVIGATVITAPSSAHELGLTDRIIVLREGRIIQEGTAADVFAKPIDEAAAMATGEINVIPVTIRGDVVDSAIGEWRVDPPPFAGDGIAIARPDDFTLAAKGEDSDLIFGIEEASFRDGRWHLRGLLSGGVVLRVALPREANVHKGRLMALRYDPARFRLVPGGVAPRISVPTDAMPSLRDSR